MPLGNSITISKCQSQGIHHTRKPTVPANYTADIFIEYKFLTTIAYTFHIRNQASVIILIFRKFKAASAELQWRLEYVENRPLK